MLQNSGDFSTADRPLSAIGDGIAARQRRQVRLTLEIEADAEDGFSEADIGVVSDNARRLKFKTESTAFGVTGLRGGTISCPAVSAAEAVAYPMPTPTNTPLRLPLLSD
jgi:hypothetical protein